MSSLGSEEVRLIEDDAANVLKWYSPSYLD